MGHLRLIIQKDSHLNYLQVVVCCDFQILQLQTITFGIILIINFPLSWVMC